MDFETIITHLAKAVAERGLSLIIATAALMSLVHLRNSHLSDRTRASITERLYALPSSSLDDKTKTKHSQSLLWQAEQFAIRYERTSKAFVHLVKTLLLLMVSIVFCTTPDKDFMQPLGILLALIGAYFMIVALCLLVKEFHSGKYTLERHISITEINQSRFLHPDSQEEDAKNFPT